MTIFVNDREVVFTQYPNGELVVPHVEIYPYPPTTSTVRLHWTGDDDWAKLALVKGMFDQHDYPRKYPALFIDYMPYSRMDRAQDGHCFSLKWVCQLVNAMKWSRVYVVEPHSDATLELLDNAEPLWATAKLVPKAMKWIDFDKERDYLVLPDAGAYKRYSALVPEIEQCNSIVLKKKREFATGKILGLETDYIILRHDVGMNPERKALIIDDLSSRGGTFVAAAALLRDRGLAKHVALLVTHMEPVGLLGDLPKKLDRVFCTDTMSFPRPVPANFEVFQRSDWL